MGKLTGMSGDVTVGSTAVPVGEWSLNTSNEVQDVTDTGSGGWVDRIAGVSSAEGSIRAFWGSTVTDLTTTFALGTVISATLAIGASTKTVSGSFIVANVNITNNAKNAVEAQITIQSKGAVTIA